MKNSTNRKHEIKVLCEVKFCWIIPFSRNSYSGGSPGTTTCGSGVDNVTGTGFGGKQIASGLSFTGSEGLLGGVTKVGDSGGDLGVVGGSLNCGGGDDGGLMAGISTGIGVGLMTG